MSEIIESASFRLAILRSERVRVYWTLALLLALFAFAFARDLMTAAASFSMLTLALLFVVSVGYEIYMLVSIGRWLRAGTPPSERVWLMNVVAEALFPTAVVLVATLSPSGGPYRALVMPAVYLYFLLFTLSTLRLRPDLCRLSGIVAAAGYLGAIILTALLYRTPTPEMGASSLAFYLTGVFFILVGGFAAAAVAGQIRGHVVVAMREAQARLDSRNTVIFGLAKLAEYRDTDTGTHLERIAEYGAILAEAMGSRVPEINEAWIKDLRLASSMHDIGKVGIPDSVLCKPGRLTDDERAVMQRHPGLGAETLNAIHEKLRADPLLEMSIRIAMGHHERWDGKGYPNGIAGDEIDLAARIISVADVYDALTSKRVYKEAMEHGRACEIIREGRGTQFDPAVVDAFDEVAARFDEVRAQYHAGEEPAVT